MQDKSKTHGEIEKMMKTAKVVMAESDLVDRNEKNIKALLTMIAEYMEPDDPEWREDFVETCFVSDESMLEDFNLEDGDVEKLGVRLGFVVKRNDYIFQIAAKMPGGSV